MEQSNKQSNKQRRAAMVFLLLLAPAMGELLSGSSPPNEYFNPFGFIVMTILYGGGALLIREAKARWNLGWSVIFLAIAYGILEEGLMVQSFYNHHHLDLGVMSRYGMFLKTQWPWAIQLTTYHAIVSTMIPIMATDLLFPKTKNKPLLGKNGIIAWMVLLCLDVIIFAVFIIVEFGKYPDPYVPDALNLFIWTLITAGFVYLAYRFRNSHRIVREVKMKSPFKFGLYAFLFMWITLLTPYVMGELNVPAIICVAVQLILAGLAILFVFNQVYNAYLSVKHQLALIAGTVLCFVTLSPISEFVNGFKGMFATGVTFLVLLVVYCWVVLRKKKL